MDEWILTWDGWIGPMDGYIPHDDKIKREG